MFFIKCQPELVLWATPNFACIMGHHKEHRLYNRLLPASLVQWSNPASLAQWASPSLACSLGSRKDSQHRLYKGQSQRFPASLVQWATPNLACTMGYSQSRLYYGLLPTSLVQWATPNLASSGRQFVGRPIHWKGVNEYTRSTAGTARKLVNA